MSHAETVVLYHGGCPDGFGGAFAAWKKFGDSVEYIPVKHGYPAPTGLEGRKLIFIDFCYPQEIMDTIVATATSVTVLDHHLGTKNIVERMPEFLFDEKRSGATIAWGYFHPDTPVPALLRYVQDGDLFLFTLPHSHAILSYAYAQKFSFENWGELVQKLEDPKGQEAIIEKGNTYAEYFSILTEQIANKATLVSFEGYECYLASGGNMFTSDVGHCLATIKPPLGLVANLHGDVLSISLRSDESVDVSAIARKYGGNGHPRASAFRLKWGDPLPWTVVNEDTPIPPVMGAA